MAPIVAPAEVLSAFHRDDADEVRRLLDAHPELKSRINDAIGPFDSPPIMNVRSRAMLDVLLEAGADVNARSKWWAGGFGLLDCAPPELAAYAIERGAVVDAHSASRLGMLEKLKELVAANPSLVNAKGGDGQTPLHFASSVEIADFLIDQGADLDALDVDHESTPAQYMLDDRQEVARRLVERGCRADILMAAALGDVALAARLIDENPECVRIRVSDEFFPMIRPNSGGTIYQWKLGWYVSPRQIARKFHRDDVRALLTERSPAAVLLLDACWEHDEPAIGALLARQPDLAGELTMSERRHVAHAARNSDAEAVRLMLACGLPADSRGQHQATPLHWAAFHGNPEMAKTILARNPPLESRDADFNGTPMGWAVHGSEHGWYCKSGDYAGVVSVLLAAGAKPPEKIGGAEAVQEVLRSAGASG